MFHLLCVLLLVGLTACGAKSNDRQGAAAFDSPTPSATAPLPTASPAEDEPVSASPTPMISVPAERQLKDCGDHHVQKSPPDGITVSLELSRTAISQGESIKMTVRAKNNTDKEIQYSYPRGRDFWVRSGDVTVWSQNYRLGFTADMQEDSFAPHEEKTRSAIWDQSLCNPDESSSERYFAGPAPKGTYEVRGEWVPGWWAPSVTLTIK